MEGGRISYVWQLVLCVVVSVLVQFFLPHVIQFWNCDILGKCDSGKSTALSAGISILPDLDIHRRDGDTSELYSIVIKKNEFEEVSPAVAKEAFAAVTAAQNYRESGNLKKAKLVIEHAVSLMPHHPDVLTEYGAIFEHFDDYLEADLCYSKALVADPAHSKALERRRKTLPLVNAADQKMLNDINKKRDQFDRLPHTSSLRRAMRESYFMHIYHTVAIEGNTLSLGETRSILETGFPVPGKSLVEHNEVIGMDSALRYMNHSLLNQMEISLDDILEIHRRVLGNVNPVDAGRIRSTQVYVGKFTPVAPQYVREQMEELVAWLNSPSTAEIDPIEKAAIAHYKLVVVHPFVDGNGRTARLLMNLILMKAGFPPVILPVESRAEYYAILNTANLGELRPFVRYVATHTLRALQHYISISSACNNNQCSPVISSPETIEP